MTELNPPSDSSDTPKPDDWLRDVQMSSWFVDPEGTALIREADGLPPLELDDFNRWLASQTPEMLQMLESSRNQNEEFTALSAEVHQKLIQSVPELYEARLPSALEVRLNGVNFAIGINQTMAGSVDEATVYLQDAKGIDYTGYGLNHRFLIYDQSMNGDTGSLGQDNPHGITGAIEGGYFGNPKIGRFIAVFPEADRTPRKSSDYRIASLVSIDESIMPPDAIVVYTDNSGPHTSVSSKYVAGFIDSEGSFWANSNFLLSDQPALTALSQIEEEVS